MSILGIPPSLAPVATGHPLSLPEEPQQSGSTRIAPSGESADTGSSFDGSQSDGSRNERAAPPSILQIKINAMLQEQAEETRKDKSEERAARSKDTKSNGVEEPQLESSSRRKTAQSDGESINTKAIVPFANTADKAPRHLPTSTDAARQMREAVMKTSVITPGATSNLR